MAQAIEKMVRQFVRANFSARIKTADGEFQSEVKGKIAKVVIQNPGTVMAALEELCGTGKEVGNTTTYTAKKGEFKGHPITVKCGDDMNLLSLPIALIGDAE